MTLNPYRYIMKRYYSKDLTPREFKLMNFWLPFFFNRIKIIHVANDFKKVDVMLKHTFWNRNPNKSIWGGSITSALDPFFPVMMKQIILRKGIHTAFYSRAVHVEFLHKVESHLYFHFKINDAEVMKAEEKLENSGKYESWHTADGVDDKGNVCVHGQVQVYLRRR